MTATETRISYRPVPERRPSKDAAAKKSRVNDEGYPGTAVPRRDDRIRSVGSSFEEIRESSEEAEEEDLPPPSPLAASSSKHSPYAVCPESLFRRSLSLSQQQHVLLSSPKNARRLSTGSLQRNHSEPAMPRRKSSLGIDSISLAPIPETVSPSSPNTKGEPPFRCDSE